MNGFVLRMLMCCSINDIKKDVMLIDCIFILLCTFTDCSFNCGAGLTIILFKRVHYCEDSTVTKIRIR